MMIFDLPEEKDPLVQRVLDKIDRRSSVGMKTYGVSMEDNNTKTVEEWIEDAQEEMMDAVIYLEKVKGIIKKWKK